MAHTNCYKGHDMWNGDGKTCVWAYRVDFLIEYMKKNPTYRLDTLDEDGNWSGHIYDCVDKNAEEDLDCWYCDKCKCLAVFLGDPERRLDYEPMGKITEISMEDIKDWADYIAARDPEFESFQDFYVGMDLVSAINEFDFRYRYKVSRDRKYIYAYNKEKEIVFGYELKEETIFDVKREANELLGTPSDVVAFENMVTDGFRSQKDNITKILKTFYSKDGCSRWSINKRSDGLFELLPEEIQADYYWGDDDEIDFWFYEWDEVHDVSNSITDSPDILEQWCMDDGYLEAPRVYADDYVQLKDGRTCKLIRVLENGNYEVSFKTTAEELLVYEQGGTLDCDAVISVFDIDRIIEESNLLVWYPEDSNETDSHTEYKSKMRGLQGWSDAKFDKFFELVQEEAAKSDSIFFVFAGEGNDFETEQISMEDLSGWLIPNNMADAFERDWLEDKFSDKMQQWEDYFAWVEWAIVGGKVVVNLNILDY